MRTNKHTYRMNRPWVSSLGVKRLREIAEWAVRRPDEYRQDDWHCGSAMCIAGRAAMAYGGVTGIIAFDLLNTVVQQRQKLHGYGQTVHADFCPIVGTDVEKRWEEIASEVLGIPVDPYGWRLFGTPDGWPAPFDTDYEQAETRKGKARVAAARIEYFIKTGE
jgi:hypothetical protein